jgi:plasmid maintenance system antidote protein VapI
MRMRNPPHPGRIARHACLEPLGLTVTAAAALRVTRQDYDLAQAERAVGQIRVRRLAPAD